MSSRISSNSLVKRTPDQVCCDLGGESIILNLKSGIYYSLDEVGARIWALIEHPMAIIAIRDAILNEYEVQVDVCERDVRGFIEGMDAAGLVEVLVEVNDEAIG